MNALPPLLILGGILALIGLVVYLGHRAEKKRAREFEEAAADLGFEFAPWGDPAVLHGLREFHLFSQGHSRKMRNLLRGKAGDLEVAIFDYRYTTGSGKHQRVWNHSVVRFNFGGPGLPAFSLRPENVWHKIGSWFGYRDIDFDTHPAFSRAYLLRGADEDAVRGLFTDAVLEFYEREPGLSTEGAGNTLVFYRHSVRVGPRAVRGFLEDGFRVLALFRPAA
jgi:hypothetical protein